MNVRLFWLSVCFVGCSPWLSAQDVADSVSEWSNSGVQGTNGWSYGYYNLTADGNGTYQSGDFTPFAPAEWDGASWRLSTDPGATGGPWTIIQQEDTHPNGTNSTPGDEHWTIRRWQSDHTGAVAINWHMRKVNPNGDGVRGYVFVNGTEVDSRAIAGGDTTGFEETVVVNLSSGDLVDLALSPSGSDGADGSANWMRISTDLPPPPSGDIIAQSMDDWSTSGTQGENGWEYGYYNLTTDGNSTYETGDLILFSPSHWTGSEWDLLAAGSGPWTVIGQESTHPNGTNSAPNEEHWTVRRWTSDYDGGVAITWHMRKSNTGGGNGVGGKVFVDGVEVDSAVIAGGDGVGITQTVPASVSVGSLVDLVLTPNGSDGSDGSANWMEINTDLTSIPDEDDDGVFDSQDNCPSVANAAQTNSDADSLGDACDNCPFVANETQSDRNSNGIGDDCEDSDSDGVFDTIDNCPDISNPGQEDSDSDDVGTVCDNCPTTANRLQRDIDEDGLGDACDPDTPGSTSGPWPVYINELHFNPAEGEEFEFLELRNPSGNAINMSLWSFRSGLNFEFPPGTEIPANGYLVLCSHPDVISAFFGIPESLLIWSEGSSLDNGGENILLADALGIEVDQVRYDDQLPWASSTDGGGDSLQRLCLDVAADLPSNWSGGSPTPMAANVSVQCPPPAPPVPSVAINEIYYHPPDNGDSLYEYVELKNTTNQSIDLNGYSFSQGIGFTFTSSVVLGAGDYLVVCRNEASVQSFFGITNTVGNFIGQLSNSGERLTLLDDAGALVDSVRYEDSGEFSVAADGLGASLEKVLATAPSNAPGSWLDSGVSDPDAGAGDWRTVTVRGEATSSRLYVYLRGPGEALIDDVSLVDVANPGINLLPNFGFPSSLGTWVGNGNHSTSRWSQDGAPSFDEPALHLISTGTGTGSSNAVRVETLSPLDLDPAVTYELTFSYLLLGGNTDLVARLSVSTQSRGIYWERGGATVGDVSPGVANIAERSEVPPFISHVQRWPIEPTSSEPTWIYARVAGDDVDSVTLTADLSSGSQQFTMVDDGSSNDGEAGDGIYGVQLPAQPHDYAVTFKITAESSTGASRVSPLPTDTEEFHGYYVNDNQPFTPLPVFNFLVPSGDPRGYISSRSCSSYSTISFAHRGDLYYNVGLRRRGGSVCGSGKPYLKLRFNKGHEFQFSGDFKGHKNLNFQSLYTDKSLIRETMTWNVVFQEMGRAYCSHEFVRTHANGEYFGLYAAMERPDKRFLERNGLFPDGNLYKATASREQRDGTYEKKTNELEPGGDADLRDFLNDMHDSPAGNLVNFFQTRTNEDAILEYQLSQVIINNSDYPHKNHYLYHDTQVGEWRPTGWDLDLSYGKRWDGGNGGVFNDAMHNPGTTPWHTTSVRGGGVGNHLLDKFFAQAGTHYRRAYVARLWDVLHEKYLLNLYDERFDFYEALLYDEQFDDIEEWGRTGPFGDPSAPPDFLSNIQRVRNHIEIRRAYLIDYLSSVEGHDGHDRLRITEVMYNPFGPDTTEFLELWNNSGNAVDISGWSVSGIGAADGSYVFPAGTVVAEDEVFILARDPVTFTNVYGNVARVLGPYAGGLDNEGEVLRVRDGGPGYPATVDYLRYGTNGDWPPAANGRGFSMELQNVTPNQDNDWGYYWEASTIAGGTPGIVAGVTPGAALFRRGDPNSDGIPDISDALFLLFYQFASGPAPSCLQSADVDNNEAVDLTDVLSLLNYLFLNAAPPPSPFFSCGAADLDSALDCAVHPACL